MTNVTKAFAACAGTIALICAVAQPAKAADMPNYPQQYGAPPPVQEPYVQQRYVYQEPPPVYYRQAPPPVIYQEYAPPAVVPVPGPYYVPPRRVYVAPGYSVYGYAPGPYVARSYGYHRSWGPGHRRW